METRRGIREYLGETVVLGIRPEGLEDAALVHEAPQDRRLRGTIELREALGSEIVAHVRVADAVPAITEDVVELQKDVGVEDTDPDAAASADGAVVVGRLDPRSGAEEGRDIELVVDTEALHFFDPGSGLAIYEERPIPMEVEDEGGDTNAPEPAVAAGAAPGGDGDGAGGRLVRWRRR